MPHLASLRVQTPGIGIGSADSRALDLIRAKWRPAIDIGAGR